jgi:hypothetical protein
VCSEAPACLRSCPCTPPFRLAGAPDVAPPDYSIVVSTDNEEAALAVFTPRRLDAPAPGDIGETRPRRDGRHTHQIHFRPKFEGSDFDEFDDRGRAARRLMRMSQMKWRAAAPLLTAALLLVATAEAKNRTERGKIVSTDWSNMKMEISSPNGRTKFWNVQRDCTVKFSDKTKEFPNPTLKDLREPMYIWFMFKGGTDVIHTIDVKEVGFEPSKGGPGVQQTGVITNLDANIGHVELDLGTGPQTFKVEPKEQLKAFKRGQKVKILIDDRGPQEIVTKITPER